MRQGVIRVESLVTVFGVLPSGRRRRVVGESRNTSRGHVQTMELGLLDIAVRHHGI